jgi:hypothetical protein
MSFVNFHVIWIVSSLRLCSERSFTPVPIPLRDSVYLLFVQSPSLHVVAPSGGLDCYRMGTLRAAPSSETVVLLETLPSDFITKTSLRGPG